CRPPARRCGDPWEKGTGGRCASRSPRKNDSGPLLLSRCSGANRAAAVDGARRRGPLQRQAERIVRSEGFEVGIASGETTVLRVGGDRWLEVRNRFRMLTPLSVGDGEHVKRVVVIGVLVAHETQVSNRLVVSATVDRERCGV